jgi:tetratricopeptide (TPR) repeat protein
MGRDRAPWVAFVGSEAIIAYGLCVDRVPEHAPEAYDAFQEGSRLLAAGSSHAAAVALERARGLAPGHASIHETLGRAYFRTARYPLARDEFALAIELDPVNDYAHFGIGLALARLGDLPAARRHLKLAVAMRPLDDYIAALAEIGEERPDEERPDEERPVDGG